MSQEYNNELEIEYTKKSDPIKRKKLGQFFTPYKIARFMSQWLVGNSKSELDILDPSAGLGIFARALNDVKVDKKVKLIQYEIDPEIAEELESVTSKLNIMSNTVISDFLTSSWDKQYDAIIANPPYYKHHFIQSKLEILQNMSINAGHKFSIQTNIYCWFLIKSLSLLALGGRIAFIVPSEFLNANYGEAIKEYVLRSGIVLHLININFKNTVFDNALTTSVIILGERSRAKSTEINFYNVDDTIKLSSLNEFILKYPKITYKVRELDSKRKWRNYFIETDNKIKSENIISFTQIGRFSRGIATGSNDFFMLSEQEADDNRLPSVCLIPCMSRSANVSGIKFTKEDFQFLRKKNAKIYLFDGQKSNDKNVIEYIKKGEKLEINRKYLTSKRVPWYSLEKRSVSKIWLSVFNRKKLKFVWNETDCLNLTTFHCFYPSEFGKKYMDIIFIYIMCPTAKRFFEMEKREYGNGLEKYEPNDINKSMMVNFESLASQELADLKDMQTILLSSNGENTSVIQRADAIFSNLLKLEKPAVSYLFGQLPLES